MSFFPFDKWIRWAKEYIGEATTPISDRIDSTKTVVDGTQTTVGTINTKIGSPSTSLTVDIAAVKGDTAANKLTLENGTYGLSALKTETDNIDSAISTVDGKVVGVKAVVDANKLTLEDSTNGLTAIKNKTNNIASSTAAISVVLGSPVLSSMSLDIAALDAKVSALNSGDTSFGVKLPERTDRPTAGNKYVEILITHKNKDGNMDNFDAAPTVLLENQAGTDRSTYLYNASGTQTNVCDLVSTGLYKIRIQYTAATPLEFLRATIHAVEQTIDKYQWAQTELVSAITDAFTGTDRTMLTNIDTNVSDVESKLGAVASGTVASVVDATYAKAVTVDGKVDIIDTNVDTANVKLLEMAGTGFASGTNSLVAITNAVAAIEGLPILFEAVKSESIGVGSSTTVQLTEVELIPSVAWKHGQLSIICDNSTHKFDVQIYKDAACTKLWYDDYSIKANNAVGGIGENLGGLPFINGDAVKVSRMYVKITVQTGTGSGTYTVSISGEKATVA